MKRAPFFVLGALVALQPAPGSAQVFSGTPYAQEYQQFIGGSGVGSVGPYRSSFIPGAGSPRVTATDQFSVYCVDYLHWASNSTGLVNVAGLSSGDLSTTRLQNAGLDRYRKSAYLASMFESWGSLEADLETAYSAANGGAVKDYGKSGIWHGLHYAIWEIATGPADLGGTDLTNGRAFAREYFVGLANDGIPLDFPEDEWYVVSRTTAPGSTSDYDGTGQEFLMRAVSVPEPSSLLLMFTGLFLLVVVRRKSFAGLGKEV
jgi:hypothetical protein